jgi:hypothetical protein
MALHCWHARRDSTSRSDRLNKSHVCRVRVPCQPASSRPACPLKPRARPPGNVWLHEINHDGFRVIARKDGPRVKLYRCRPQTPRGPPVSVHRLGACRFVRVARAGGLITTSNPAIEQGGCPGRGSRTRGEARVRPSNTPPAPKVPSSMALPFNSSRCRPSFRRRFQQLPRTPFVGVPWRTEQYRVQPPLPRRPHP